MSRRVHRRRREREDRRLLLRAEDAVRRLAGPAVIQSFSTSRWNRYMLRCSLGIAAAVPVPPSPPPTQQRPLLITSRCRGLAERVAALHAAEVLVQAFDARDLHRLRATRGLVERALRR